MPRHTANDRTPYTYLIRFIPTGQVYYGSRTGYGCHPNELFNFNIREKDRYVTSSKLVKSLLNTYGPEAFEWEVRRVFDDPKRCLDWERRVLSKFSVEDDPRFLNLDSKQRSELAIQNNTATKFVYDPVTEVCIRIPTSKPNPIGWVAGCPKKMGVPNINKGTKWIYNPNTNESKMIPKSEFIPNGWVPGRGEDHSKRHSEKLKAANRKHYTNGIETGLYTEEEAPEGWRRGRTLKVKPSGKRNGVYVWIRNETESTQIKDNDVIPNGWWRGRILHKKTPPPT